jgi:hypothetical protein
MDRPNEKSAGAEEYIHSIFLCNKKGEAYISFTYQCGSADSARNALGVSKV